jgi:hypothetical protein
MKYSQIKTKDKNMMDIEDVHTMKTNIMRLTLLIVTLRETATKMESLRGKSIEHHSQGMNGTFLLPVNLCFGEQCLFCQKISMSNGIFMHLRD